MKVKDLNLNIRKKQILDNVSFDIMSKTALIGPNGSGKTMTLSVLAQLIRPDSGSMIFSSRDVLHDESFKHEMGTMIQDQALDSDKNVIDMLKFIRKLKHDTDTDIESILNKCKIDGTDKIKDLPHGKYKIILILTAFLGNPKIVFLDEPFSGIDVINRKIIKSIIKSYNGKLLITSHLLSDIKEVCKDAVFIKEGRIIKKKDISKIKDLDKYYIKVYS